MRCGKELYLYADGQGRCPGHKFKLDGCATICGVAFQGHAKSRFGFRPKPNGSMPLAAVRKASFGGAISYRLQWPIVKAAMNPMSRRSL